MSDEGNCATACHPTELRELADASDREGEKGKSEMHQIQRAYLPIALEKEISGQKEGKKQWEVIP